MKRPHPSRFLAFVLLSAAPWAQEAQAPITTSFSDHGLVAVQVVEGTTWAAGSRYKARFAGGGFELFPSLGATAPSHLPVAFRLESVRVGGKVFWSGDPAAPPRVDGAAVVYERRLVSGERLIERYDATVEGLEQSFTLEARPAARGDLVVRGRLATELSVASADERAGIELRAPGLGGVRIGGVVGIDAQGRAADGTVHLVGDVLELTLPAAFVDRATFPLVLDPAYEPVKLVVGSAGVGDVAWQEQSGRYLVVYSQHWGLSDEDVFGLLLDGSGQPLSLVLIDVDLDLAYSPSAATNAMVQGFGVVWSKATVGSRVQIVRLDPSGALSMRVSLSPTCPGYVIPDVGGDLSGTSDGVIAVWEEGGSPAPKIVAARVGLAGDVPTPASYATVWPGVASSEYGSVRISQGVAAGRHLIVFRVNAPDGLRLYARGIDLEGSLDPTTYAVTPASPDYVLTPLVDGDGSTFWIGSWGNLESAIRRIEFHAGGATLGPVLPEPGLFAVGLGSAKLWTSGLKGGAGPLYVQLAGHDPDTGDASGPPEDVGEMSIFGPYLSTGYRSFDLALRRSGAAGFPSSLGVYLVYKDHDDVIGVPFEELGPGGPTADLGGGCGGGTCRSAGPAAIGAPPEVFEISLALAPSESTLGILNVNAPVATIACGPCAFLPHLMTWIAPIEAGEASVPLGIPHAAELVGAKIVAQWAVLPTAASPCPLVAGVAFSNLYEIEIGL